MGLAIMGNTWHPCLKGEREETVPGIQQKHLYGKAPQTQPTRAVILSTEIETLCSNTGRVS